MVAIAFSLLALGLSDIAAGGLASRPMRWDRVALGAVVTALVMSAYSASAGWSGASIVLAAAVIVGTATWQTLRLDAPSERRSSVAAALLIVLFASLVLAGPRAGGTVPKPIAALLTDNPVHLLATTPAETLLAGLGLFAVLAATTNGFVRSVLRASGTRLESSENTLRGGRLIGVIERWLILALVVAGEPTAAALVVSAKSLVRFPELRSTLDTHGEESSGEGPATGASPHGARPPREIDYVTEYFLLGSMLSWSAAVLAALMLIA